MASICNICKKEAIVTKYDPKNKIWGCGDCIRTIIVKNLKQHKDITAVFTDPKGNEFAVDKNGDLVPDGDHRYNTKEDPHGWKATGKEPKKRKYFI